MRFLKFFENFLFKIHKKLSKKSVIHTKFIKNFGNIKFYGFKSAVILCKFETRILSDFLKNTGIYGTLLIFGGRLAKAFSGSNSVPQSVRSYCLYYY